MKRPLLFAGLLAPLLITVAPRSFLAHDAGYYALQARWIEQSNQWLAPLWFGEPVFDRCIGAQWLMALSLKLFGGASWAVDVPAMVAAVISFVLTGWLAKTLISGRTTTGLLAVVLLALTPLWLNYAHLATQDMPLLAVEMVGICALVASRPQGRRWMPVAAGAAPGVAFLIKGFMVALPVLAIAPFLLLERRWLLKRWLFWLGVVLGLLPVALWLGLSLQAYGLAAVSGLWQKLLFLSQADVYAAGPLYYLWNIPANTAPWILGVLAGWPLLWRSHRDRAARLVLLLYPLLLLILLSAFRTKTPYYGLQLTPWIAIAAALGLERWAGAERGLGRRLDPLLAVTGALVLMAAVMTAWPGSALRAAVAAGEGLPPLLVLIVAAGALGLSWLVVPWQPSPSRRLSCLLLGPWLALVLLTQGGLFSDRSASVRLALSTPEIQDTLDMGPIQAAADKPLDGGEHAQLILLALATPQPPDQLLKPAAVQPGQVVWIRRSELADPEQWQIRGQAPALQGWVLAQRRSNPAVSGP